jgi:type IV pilus assembly protein PilC
MGNYVYKVVTKDGKEKKGTIESSTKEKAMFALKQEGNKIVSIEEGSVLNKEIKFGSKKVKSRDVSVFCRQFYSLLTAGVPIVTALEMLGEQTESKTMAEAIRNMHASVRKGESHANAMRKEGVFPSVVVSMISAGEASGNMEGSLIRMAEHFEKDAKLKGMVKKAMIYPIVLLVVAVAVLVIMVVAVIPSFSDMFADMGSELPGLTQALLDLSKFIQGYWYIIIIVVVGLVAAYKFYTNSDGGKRTMATLSMKLPGLGNLNTKSESARFARTLSTMLASGMTMVEAMSITSSTMENILFREALEEATIQIQRGVSLQDTLKKCGLFPPLILHMVGIGEETGNLEEMLNNCANYYEEETELATQSLMAMMEPMIIIVLAVIVCVILGAIYGPMVTMYNELGAM